MEGAVAALRAGAAKVDITPPLDTPLAGHFEERRAIDVEDPLYARALVLESEDVRLGLVVCDLICVPTEDVARIRERVARRAGIGPERLMVAATHTHTAASPTGLLGTPRADAYMTALPERVATAVEMAVARLRPARLGVASATVEGVAFCRRFRMRDGTVRMNPGRGNADALEPVSPVDPALTALYVEEATSQAPIALWSNFTLHYVGTDDARRVSADYFGRFCRIAEAALGGGLAMLSNGASGQINNVDVRDPEQPSGGYQAERVARAVAGAAISAAGRARLRERVPLSAAARTTRARRRAVTRDDLVAAERILAAPEGMRPAGVGPHPFSWARGQPLPDGLLHTYAREVRYLADMPEELPAEVQVLRVGDAALVGLPGEIFVELGLALKASSPAACTAVVGLANGYLGYVPDEAAFEQGGYETWAARSAAVERGTGEALVKVAADLLRALWV